MSSRGKSVWLVLMLSVAAQAAFAEEVFLKLRPKVEVDDSVVLLGDVAEVSARQPAAAAQLGRIEVARLPTLTKAISIGRAEISRSLAQHGTVLPGSVAWGGADEVVLTGRPRRIDLAPAIDTAAGLLLDPVGSRQHVEIKVIDDGGAVVGPPGRTRMRPEMESARRIGRTIIVPILVEVDSVVIAHPVVRFEILRKGMAMSHAHTAAESPAVELAVRKDRLIRLVVETGSVRLEGEGVALADARQGDRVMVRRTGNASELLGRATGPGLVVVEEN